LTVLCDGLMHWHTVTSWWRKWPPICVSLPIFYTHEKSPDKTLHASHYWSTSLM